MSHRLKNRICISLIYILAVSPLRFAVADASCVDTNTFEYVDILLLTPVVALEEYEQRGHHDSHGEYETTVLQDHDASHCTPGHVCPAIVGVASVCKAQVRQTQIPRYYITLRFTHIVFLPFKPPRV
jgi:hypothetical protein